jgi:hypothetical protein
VVHLGDNYGCRIGDPAERRKHGISDDDIRHAINNAVAAIRSANQPDFTMLIGPATASRLLEIGNSVGRRQRLRDPRDAGTTEVPDDDRTQAR